MVKKLFLFIFVIILFCQSNTSGQEKILPGLRIDSRFHYGFIMPHHESLRYLQRGHIPGFNLKISKSTYGMFPWAEYYRYPDVGLAYYHADLKWDEVLGNVNAVYSFVNFPVTRKRFFDINYNVEMGLSFLSKHFDEKENVYNIAIGSMVNFYFSTGVDLNFKLSEKLYLSSGLSLRHFSNGAVNKPNKGINLVQANVGVTYFIRPLSIPDKSINIRRNKYLSIIMFGNIGTKQIQPAEGKYHIISSTYTEFRIDLSNRKSLGLGFDVFYDGSIRTRMDLKGVENNNNFSNVRQGVHLAYNTHFGPFVFSFQAGSYFLVNWNDDDNIYSRLSLQYSFDRFIVNLSLKTHYGRADYIEWGVGYLLWQKER